MEQNKKSLETMIQELLGEIPKQIEQIRQQNYAFAFLKMAELIPQLELVENRLKSETVLQEEFQSVLSNILQAQEQKDYILMADFLELLLIPFFYRLQEKGMKENWKRKEPDTEGKKRFWNRYPVLAKQIFSLPERTLLEQAGYQIEKTSSGAYTLSITRGKKRVYLHSNINPVWEAHKLAEYWYDVEKSVYIVYGLGLGYPILELAKKDNSIQIQVYESDLVILSLALSYGVLEELLSDERICLVYDPNGEILQREVCRKNVEFLPFYPSVITTKKEVLRVWLELQFIQYQGMKNQELQLRQNFRENCRISYPGITKLEKRENGKRFFIISAGPSLDDNYMELRNKRPTDVLLATAPVLRKLLQAGIQPNYVVISESSEKQKMLLEGLEELAIPLLFLSTASRDYVQKYPGEKYILCQKGFEGAEQLAKEKNWPLLEVGGSVAIVALSVAIELGAREVVFVGQDLAYTKNKRHAEYTSGTELYTKNSFCYTRKDIYGNPVLVPRNLELFRIRLEELIAKNPHICFKNATEGGVPIKGAANVRLKELF